MNIYVVILLTLIAALISSLGQLMFKKSVTKISSFRQLLGQIKNKGVVLGGIAYIGAFVIYLAALSGGELSVVYPIFASSFIFVTIFSAWILKERITVIRAVGVLLVFIGITIVAVS